MASLTEIQQMRDAQEHPDFYDNTQSERELIGQATEGQLTDMLREDGLHASDFLSEDPETGERFVDFDDVREYLLLSVGG